MQDSLKSKRTIVGTTETLWWRLHRDDASSHTLIGAGLDACILNPLANKEFPIIEPDVCGPWFLASGELHLGSKGVVLEWTEARDHRRALEDVLTHLPRLFAGIRHISGQYRLTATGNIDLIAVGGDDALNPRWPHSTEVNGMVRAELVTLAMPFAKIPDAVDLAARGGPPVYGTFLLDAMKAHSVADWRMALLLAAMAVETAAGEALSEWKEARLAATPRPAGVIEIAVAGRGTVVKDPVYDVLADRPGFKYLMHERPLHVAGRSLLVEDEVTYQRMLRLYAARNKIAHLGGPTAVAQECYQLERVDVEEALEATLRCLAFFGKQVGCAIGLQNVGDFVDVKAGTWRTTAVDGDIS